MSSSIVYFCALGLLAVASTLGSCVADAPPDSRVPGGAGATERRAATAADVVGPDGLLYPDWTGAGVTGGIPSAFEGPIDPERPPRGAFVQRVAGRDDEAVAQAWAAARSRALAEGSRPILYFPPGVYELARPVTLDVDGVVVAGAGRDRTRLRIVADPGSPEGGSLFQFDGGAWSGPFLHVSADVPRGSGTLPLAEDPVAAGYQTGDWVRLAATRAESDHPLRKRYDHPPTGTLYSEPIQHFGRVYVARVRSVHAPTRTIELDRVLPHDVYAAERPQLRRADFLVGVGLQDLAIETASGDARLDPFRHRRVAESWVRGVVVDRARDWPISPHSENRVRFEIRDSAFLGTWAPIGSGSRAYLGWTQGDVDCLMDQVQARDLRHMAIFQSALRCVVRRSVFTGDTATSPQLHGRFPADNLIENCVFGPWTTPRGRTAFYADPARSLRHGPNGPRNVFWGNEVRGGAASIFLGGALDSPVFAYNTFRGGPPEARVDGLPPVHAMDRVTGAVFVGNVFDGLPHLPAMNLEDASIRGWVVRDNIAYHTNGRFVLGSGTFADARGNVASTEPMPVGARARPPVPSIFEWQRRPTAVPARPLSPPDTPTPPFETRNLPAGWATGDFATATPGSAVHDGGTWTLRGAGVRMETYMGGLGRSGRRFAWTWREGDGALTARLVRVDPGAEAGLMAADDLAPLTEFFATAPGRPVHASGNRYDAAGAVNAFGPPLAADLPVWLRIERRGSVFIAYHSPDGRSWTETARVDFEAHPAGAPSDYRSRSALDAGMAFGLFVNSGSPDRTAAARFDSVSFEPR